MNVNNAVPTRQKKKTKQESSHTKKRYPTSKWQPRKHKLRMLYITTETKGASPAHIEKHFYTINSFPETESVCMHTAHDNKKMTF